MAIQTVKDDTYAYHHGIVQKGLSDFLQVAQSLYIIKEQKLFKEAGYKTFVAYCKEEHGIGKSEAYRIAASYEVASEKGVDKSTATALLECPKENRDEILDTATQRAGGVENVNRSLILDINDELIEDAVKNDMPDTSQVQGDLDTASVRRLLEMIRRCYQELKVVIERPEGRHIPLSRVETDLRNAGEAVKMSIPTRTCPVCNGSGCKLCHGTGWLPEHLYQASKEFE